MRLISDKLTYTKGMKRIPVDFNTLQEDNSILVDLASLEPIVINEEVVLYDNEYEELTFLGRVRGLYPENNKVSVGVTWGNPYGD